MATIASQQGEWSLAPAFDLTFAYNPEGRWTRSHQMTINGKQDGFAVEDFRACAMTAGLDTCVQEPDLRVDLPHRGHLIGAQHRGRRAPDRFTPKVRKDAWNG